jgi:hypothetical protein
MFRTQITRHLLRPSTPIRAQPTSISITRPLSNTSALYARKGAEDKDSLQPRRSEFSLTGGDDAAAESEDAAFNPDKTSPEDELNTAGTNTKDNKATGDGNPLGVSPGNTDVSKPQPEEGRESKGGDRKTASGSGGAPKSGKGQSS